MISSTGIYEGTSFDPHRNLAVEQVLLENVAKDQCILYLWQNANTVVIGRNQNPWKECRTALLQEEGGHLARRLSGGGAVYHDLGNLNFTFLMPQPDYNVDRQLTVIQRAVELCGLATERSGRNDVLIQGRKFSGNAFYKNGRQAYHHGTLLVDVDKEKLGRYLSPSKAKLQAKGVDSVRSRVANLREFAPDLGIEDLKNAMIRAFAEVYGCTAQRISEESIDLRRVEELTQRNGSHQWLFDQSVPFTASCEERFDWGGLQLDLQIRNSVIAGAKVYTDSMDWELALRLEQALTGCPFLPEAIRSRLAEMENGGQLTDFILRGFF